MSKEERHLQTKIRMFEDILLRTKNPSLSDLELILCDWYEMDEQLPNPIFEKKEFERVSNGLWAIGEFRNYVSKQIYPETQTSIKNLREMACTFAKKMEMFASMNKKNSSIFMTAKLIGESIQDANEYLFEPRSNWSKQAIMERSYERWTGDGVR